MRQQQRLETMQVCHQCLQADMMQVCDSSYSAPTCSELWQQSKASASPAHAKKRKRLHPPTPAEVANHERSSSQRHWGQQPEHVSAQFITTAKHPAPSTQQCQERTWQAPPQPECAAPRGRTAPSTHIVRAEQLVDLLQLRIVVDVAGDPLEAAAQGAGGGQCKEGDGNEGSVQGTAMQKHQQRRRTKAPAPSTSRRWQCLHWASGRTAGICRALLARQQCSAPSHFCGRP